MTNWPTPWATLSQSFAGHKVSPIIGWCCSALNMWPTNLWLRIRQRVHRNLYHSCMKQWMHTDETKSNYTACTDFPNIVAKRHILGAMTPIRTLLRFSFNAPTPQVSSSYVYSFGSYRVDKHTHKQTNKQTDRRCWRHPTFFATYDVGQVNYYLQGSHYLLIFNFKDISRTFKDPQISFSRTNSRRKFTAWAVEQQYLMFMYVTMVQLLRNKTWYYLANVDSGNIRGRLPVFWHSPTTSHL